LYLKLSKFGLNVTITKDGCLSWTERKKKRDPFEIIKIEPTDGFNQKNSYVYDLETEAGTFQAGVGSLIVKNTDSVMIEFHTGLEGQTAIEESWRLGERASKECSALFKKPNELELEKVYCPYILYSKKRYAAKMFEKKGSDVVFKKIDVKGLQVVRRDSCPFVRDVCSSILDEILNTMDPAKAIQFAKKSARLLLQGKVPIEKLVLSRQLGSDYKSDNLAHVAVRDRMRQRAPGSEPMQGDRVQYVITDRPGKMYEKAEDPVWVAEHKLKVDYKYYMKHQLENPVLELLQPLIGNVNIFDNQNLLLQINCDNLLIQRSNFTNNQQNNQNLM
jgi:DNA polymerase delta subunit 1